MEYWKQELYHHGILGMRWGRRNGPPYPLGASDHSVSERKAGWRKSLGGGRNTESYAYKKKIAKQQKKDRDKKIQSRYDRTIERIEKPYKRGQALSDKDYAREERADDKARSAWKESKEQYKKDVKEAKLNRTDKEKLISAGKIAAGVALTAIGSYAAYKAYQQYGIRTNARRHVDVGLSALKSKDIELDLLLGKDPITGRVSVAKVNPKKSKDITLNLGQQRYTINKILDDMETKGDELSKKIGKKDYDELVNVLKELDKKTKDTYDLADAMNLLDEDELSKYVKTGVFS